LVEQRSRGLCCAWRAKASRPEALLPSESLRATSGRAQSAASKPARPKALRRNIAVGLAGKLVVDRLLPLKDKLGQRQRWRPKHAAPACRFSPRVGRGFVGGKLLFQGGFQRGKFLVELAGRENLAANAGEVLAIAGLPVGHRQQS